MKRILICVCLMVALLAAFLVPVSAAVDWLSYPTSNQYDYSSSFIRNPTIINGTGSFNYDAGVIILNSTAEDNYVIFSLTVQLQPNTVYTMSCNSTAIGQIFVFRHHDDYNSSARVVNPSVTFNSGSTGRVWFRIDNDNVNGSNKFSSFMLNRTSTRYPYQPYIPGAISDAEQEGYSSGIDFASKVDVPIYDASSIRLTVSFASSNPSFHPNSPLVLNFSGSTISSAIGFNNGAWDISFLLYDEFGHLNNSDIYITGVDLSVTWNKYYNTTNYSFLVSGASGGDLVGTVYNGAAVVGVYGEASEFWNQQVIRSISFPNGENFDKFSLSVKPSSGFDDIDRVMGAYDYADSSNFIISFVSSGTFSEGYASGYADGMLFDSERTEEAYGSGYDFGYQYGYGSGFRAGKQEGLQIAETGTFYGLMTAVVDAPVSVFSSMFNFEILGVNMLAFAQSIFSLCLVLAVLRFFMR